MHGLAGRISAPTNHNLQGRIPAPVTHHLQGRITAPRPSPSHSVSGRVEAPRTLVFPPCSLSDTSPWNFLAAYPPREHRVTPQAGGAGTFPRVPQEGESTAAVNFPPSSHLAPLNFL